MSQLETVPKFKYNLYLEKSSDKKRIEKTLEYSTSGKNNSKTMNYIQHMHSVKKNTKKEQNIIRYETEID